MSRHPAATSLASALVILAFAGWTGAQEEERPARFRERLGDGPWNHRVLLATSKDGLHWTVQSQSLAEQASVPELFLGPNGRPIILFVDASGERRGNGAMAQAGDSSWQRVTTNLREADPNVVRFRDGSYRAYVKAGLDGAMAAYSSKDGLDWQPLGEVFRNGWYRDATDPDVFETPDGWVMLVSIGPRLLRCTSADGLKFDADKMLDLGGSVSDTVKVEGGWRTFFHVNADPRTGGKMRIRSAFTRDGKTWKVEDGDRVTAPADGPAKLGVADPAPIQLADGSWLMAIKSFIEPPENRRPPPDRSPFREQPPPRESGQFRDEAEPSRPRDGFNRVVPGTEAAAQHYAKVNGDSEFTPRRGGVAAPGGPAPMRLMIATSPDGLKFERKNLIVADQGAVPDLVVDANGWIWLYFQSCTVSDEVNRVALALSKDGGASWTFRRVTLTGFESPKPDPCDPEIQLLDDGTFRLYLTWPERDQGPVTWLTESRDGVNFHRVGKAFDPGGTALDPSIIKIGETWHIFCGGGSGPDENWHGTSRDGRTFTADRSMRFTANGLNHMMANGLAVPGGWRFYGFNNPRPGQSHRIVSFFTRDGVTWTADAGTRLDDGGLAALEQPGFGPLDPAVGRLKDGTYLMVYTTRIPGTQRNEPKPPPFREQ